MPISSGRKALKTRWARAWLAAVLVAHLFLVWGLDRLTGREAEGLAERPPLVVRLLVATAPLPPPAAPPPLPEAAPAEADLAAPLANTDPAAGSAIALTEAADGSGAGRASATPPVPPPRPPVRESLPKKGSLAIQAFLGEYELGKDPLGVGEIQLSFPAQDRYEISLTARARGWVSALVSGEVLFKSEGTLSPFGLRPERYSQRTPFRGTSESLFDAERGAKLKADASWIYLPAGLQDRLSVVLQLAYIAQTRPEQFGPGQRHVIPMATDREIKPLAFTVGDPEELVLPGGILIHALRVTSDPFEFRRQGRITLWLDPADRFYPVRIQYAEPGGRTLDFLAIRDPLAP